jgi:hypothetical protein
MLVFCGMEVTNNKNDFFVIDRKFDRILREAFYPYHLLTPKQISRLLYTPGNLTTVESYLRALLGKEKEQEKYVHRFKMPSAQGERPWIYTLAHEGRKYIAGKDGLDKDIYYIPDGQEQRNYLRLMHFLELNDFLIDAKLLEKKRTDIELFDMQHDVLLQKDPVPTGVYNSSGNEIKVTSDAFLEFRLKTEEMKKRRFPVWVELDRGWHSIRSFKSKIGELIAIHENGIDIKRFGTDKITYAFPTTAGNSRVEKMKMWTRQELGTVDKTSWKNRMFCFTAVPALNEHVNVDVVELFTSPVWDMPYSEIDEKRAIIEI